MLTAQEAKALRMLGAGAGGAIALPGWHRYFRGLRDKGLAQPTRVPRLWWITSAGIQVYRQMTGPRIVIGDE